MKVLDAELDRRIKLRDHHHAAGFTTSALHAAANVVAFEEVLNAVKELIEADTEHLEAIREFNRTFPPSAHTRSQKIPHGHPVTLRVQQATARQIAALAKAKELIA